MASLINADQAHAKLAGSARTLTHSAVRQVDGADRRTELAADRTILAGSGPTPSENEPVGGAAA